VVVMVESNKYKYNIEMNYKMKNYYLQQCFRNLPTILCLSLVLLFSACATAVMVEQPITREGDDRTELQIQLDTEITNKVKKRFKSSYALKSTRLHVSTYKHVVTVNGFVTSGTQKSTALRLAISVIGVKTVISDIGIQKK